MATLRYKNPTTQKWELVGVSGGGGWGIWDYSDKPLNLYGVICLENSVYWYFLSGVAIVLDDFIRWKYFGEEKPHYRWI